MRPGSITARTMLMFLGGFAGAILVLGALAPGTVDRKVNPAQFAVPNGVTGTVCGYYGPPVKARLIEDSGFKIYRVTCGDGVIVEVAK